MTENADGTELQFAPGDEEKWRPDNGVVYPLSDGSPVITTWESR